MGASSVHFRFQFVVHGTHGRIIFWMARACMWLYCAVDTLVCFCTWCTQVVTILYSYVMADAVTSCMTMTVLAMYFVFASGHTHDMTFSSSLGA